MQRCRELSFRLQLHFEHRTGVLLARLAIEVEDAGRRSMVRADCTDQLRCLRVLQRHGKPRGGDEERGFAASEAFLRRSEPFLEQRAAADLMKIVTERPKTLFSNRMHRANSQEAHEKHLELLTARGSSPTAFY